MNAKHIFNYSGVNKIVIAINIIRLLYYKLINKRFVKKIIHNNKMLLDLNAAGISKTLFLYGKRELLETWIVKKEVKDYMNVLDVGANIGYYAILEASLLSSGKVYAFEPDDRNIELLQKNIKLNNFSDKIELYPYAVAEENCVRKFHLAQKRNLSKIVRNGETNEADDLIVVKCIKLDEFSDIDKIDFIRMDIEGYECMAIDGMNSLLQKTKKPLKLMIEIHPYSYDNDRFNFKARINYLDSIGFSIKYLISAGIEQPKMIVDSGYEPIRTVKEANLSRGLYRNINAKDLLKFLDSETKIVRALFFEKKA